MWIVLFVVIALGMYLIVVGENMNKSDYERKMEDEEQMRFFKEINKISGGKYGNYKFRKN
ncbi:MAG: hypothetical protein J6A89_01160 [Clostridia bacterium]|nr:hypothetical protein [Clostridia bacterium]